MSGLIEVHPGVGDSGRLLLCKRQGLRAVGRGALPPTRLSLATFRHLAVAACIGAELELGGRRVLSEREIAAYERTEEWRVLSARQSGDRFHRPDLIALADPPEAIEIELTDKSVRRLDELMRAWRRSLLHGQFGPVRYLCSPRALRYVERSVRRTGSMPAIGVEPLDPEVLRCLAPSPCQRDDRELGSGGARGLRPAERLKRLYPSADALRGYRAAHGHQLP